MKFLLLGCFLCLFALNCHAESNQSCSNSSSFVGFESQFTMVQHQLRGVFTIIDDCSFRVSKFDMISGFDVHWWGANDTDFVNITNGFIVSDHKLNETYKNATFVVHLQENVTWDQIHVLSIWDIPPASDFGHIVLKNDNDTLTAPDSAPSPLSESHSYSQVLTVPTMFENCKVLSKDYRVRWMLNLEDGYVDIGLESATGIMNYMAFGWADPKSNAKPMIGADVAVTGFTEEGFPFADDFYITEYSECTINKDGSAHGVCPDTIYEGSDPIGLVNNTKLIYGHREDGVSFIRFRRPINSVDVKYDLYIDPSSNATAIWALGLLKPPDALRPYYLPQNHGGLVDSSYGYLKFNLSATFDDCLGPLDAGDKEDQDLIIADSKVPLIVTTSSALHYPNPPNPSKVLFINKKEAPVLRVERGVKVTFSIQAGHDVSFYITSDLLGGNATTRNKTEIIYAGGPEAEGVTASPKELVWAPDRNTPDQVYYHSLYQQKMGWRVEVVDGGLSDMYNNSVVLDDQQVTFFWTLNENSISIAARGAKKSGYLAIGFGAAMINSYAYVGWVDDNGRGHVNTYWIDGKDSLDIHPTNENLTYVRCKSENDIITFEFTRPLKPSCKDKEPECANIIDETTPLKVIWAMGSKWTDKNLTEQNMHSVTSQRPVLVSLEHGFAQAEQDLRPVLAVHGFIMFVAWGILLPGGILAARYLKHVKGDGWYQFHVYLQYSGLSIVFLGLLFAVAELRGFYVSSLHVKFGIIAIFMACIQPVNAFLRPKKPAQGEEFSSKRVVWEYFHIITGRGAIIAGIAALFTGMKHLGDRYGGINVHGLNFALMIWFLIGALVVVYVEYREKQKRRDSRKFGRSNFVLGNPEEEDSADLLTPNRALKQNDSGASRRMELQLEPLNR